MTTLISEQTECEIEKIVEQLMESPIMKQLVQLQTREEIAEQLQTREVEDIVTTYIYLAYNAVRQVHRIVRPEKVCST
jgi:hypothetical protein